jgi:hypothetical protein
MPTSYPIPLTRPRFRDKADEGHPDVPRGASPFLPLAKPSKAPVWEEVFAVFFLTSTRPVLAIMRTGVAARRSWTPPPGFQVGGAEVSCDEVV